MVILTVKALSWATAIWKVQGYPCFNYQAFTEEMRSIFDHPVSGWEVANQLLQFCQGSRSVAEYTTAFCTLASESQWSQEALITAFQNGLSDPIKDELASRDVEGVLNT